MGCRNRRIVCNVLSGYSETWAASLVGFRCAEDWRGWTWLENSLHASVAFLTAPELGPRVDPVQQANQGFELALLVEEPGGLVVLLRGYLGNVVTETWLHVTGKPSQNTYLVISCISISLSVNYPTLLSQRFWGATLLSLEFIHCSTLTLVLNILTHFCHHLQFCLVYSHRIMFFLFYLLITFKLLCFLMTYLPKLSHDILYTLWTLWESCETINVLIPSGVLIVNILYCALYF